MNIRSTLIIFSIFNILLYVGGVTADALAAELLASYLIYLLY